MKILHCIWSFNTGGAEEMLLDIITRQAKVAEVHLIIVNDNFDTAMTSKVPIGVRVHYIRRKPGTRSPWPLIKVNMLVLKIRPDAIHMHKSDMLRIVLPGMSRKKLLTVHDIGIDLTAYRKAKRIVAISEAVQLDIRSRYGVESTVIVNGIDTDRIKYRKPLVFKDNMRVVQVGRLFARKKGQDILIKALASIVQKGYDDVTVTLIGDGPDMDMLRRLAQDAGVADKVYFAGLRDKAYIYEHLCEYDLMVHPARWEGFGLTIAEALTAGLPVAVPDEGGPFEVIDNGRFGLTFENDNVEACANAIINAHDHYDEILTPVNEARTYAVRNFSIDRTVKEYEAAYSAL